MSTYRYKRTLARPVSLKGVGVHSGLSVSLRMAPADARHGIVFHDTETGESVRATISSVSNTRFSTSLRYPSGRELATVEHLLAACSGLGITDASIDISGEELPIFDGSARAFVAALAEAGWRDHKAETTWMVIHKSISVKNEWGTMSIKPNVGLTVEADVQIGGGRIQKYAFSPNGIAHFSSTLAPARTFAHLQHIQKMREGGFIKGGSLESALVLCEGEPVNASGFRLDDECARHKVLDMIGDFALLGHSLCGAIKATSPGHTLNLLAMKELISRPDAFSVCAFSDLSQEIAPRPALAPLAWSVSAP